MLSFAVTYSNQLSTIRLGGWSALSLQKGMARMSSLHSRKELRSACFPFVALLNSYLYTREHSALFLQSHWIAPTQAAGLLTYELWLILTCESSDSHRQQTTFAAFRYVLRTPQISICKFEPDWDAEVAWSVSYAPGPARFILY